MTSGLRKCWDVTLSSMINTIFQESISGEFGRSLHSTEPNSLQAESRKCAAEVRDGASHSINLKSRILLKFQPLFSLSLSLQVVNASADDPVVLIKGVVQKPGTNVMGLIVFCLAFGLLCGQLGPEGKIMVEFFSALNDIIMKMVEVIMW